MNRQRCKTRPRVASRVHLERLEDRVVLNGSRILDGLTFDYRAIASEVRADTAVVSRDARFLSRHPDQFARVDLDQLQAAQSNLSNAIDEMVQDQADVNTLTADKIQRLQDEFGSKTEATIYDANQKILAIQDEYNALTPAQQETQAARIQNQTFRIQDGADARISRFRDILGGQERAVVFLSGSSGKQIGITLGRAEVAEAQAEDLIEQIEASEGIDTNPTSPVAGQQSGTFEEIDPNGGPSYNSNVTANISTANGVFSGTARINDFPRYTSSGFVGTGTSADAIFDGSVDTQGNASGSVTIKANKVGGAGTTSPFEARIDSQSRQIVIDLVDAGGNKAGATFKISY